MDYSEIRRLFLRTFIGFLILTALIAIGSVLTGEFGELQLKILATCLAISTASICSMACAAFMEKGRLQGLGLLGITLSIIAACLAIIGMWPEIESAEYWKTTLTAAVFAAALAHAFLLSLPELDPRHRWVQGVTAVSIGVLALQIVVAAWGEIESEAYYRLLAVVAILVGLETLLVPILMKFRQGEGPKRERLELQRVEEGLYEDASGRRYHVSEATSQLTAVG